MTLSTALKPPDSIIEKNTFQAEGIDEHFVNSIYVSAICQLEWKDVQYAVTSLSTYTSQHLTSYLTYILTQRLWPICRTIMSMFLVHGMAGLFWLFCSTVKLCSEISNVASEKKFWFLFNKELVSFQRTFFRFNVI